MCSAWARASLDRSWHWTWYVRFWGRNSAENSATAGGWRKLPRSKSKICVELNERQSLTSASCLRSKYLARSDEPVSFDNRGPQAPHRRRRSPRSEEHTSELQSRQYLVCRL